MSLESSSLVLVVLAEVLFLLYLSSHSKVPLVIDQNHIKHVKAVANSELSILLATLN